MSRFLTLLEDVEITRAKDVKKHGEHDQSSHGAWATGGGEGSTISNSMPYKLNPKIKPPIEDIGWEDKDFKRGKELLKEVATSPIAIRTYENALESIVEAGRFKTLEEFGEGRKGQEYFQARQELEVGLWGVPEKDTGPIYGFIDTPKQTGLDNETRQYGEVKIILKDNVAGRTTITAGDSANHGITPVPLIDAREGKLTSQQVDMVYRSRAFQTNASSVSQPRAMVYGHSQIAYYEAQIHGGVSLNDIKSVYIPKGGFVKESTISALESKGIKVSRG